LFQAITWHREHSFKTIVAKSLAAPRTVKVKSLKSRPVPKNGTYANLKFARKGPAINCLQGPLTAKSNFDEDILGLVFQNSITAEHFSDKFSFSNWGQSPLKATFVHI
jgi:hypothetical protein